MSYTSLPLEVTLSAIEDEERIILLASPRGQKPLPNLGSGLESRERQEMSVSDDLR